MKLIILEGPDGAGKTTLARRSAHMEYIHFGPPPKGKLGAWHQYHALLEDLWDNPRIGGVVVDRFIHGEKIYGKLLRGGTDLTWAHIRMLERVLMGMDAQLVICLPPWGTVLRNWTMSKDELLTSSRDLYDTYDFYLKLLGDSCRMLPRSMFDYTSMTFPEGSGSQLTNTGPGIGMFAPGNTLLVGDEVNKKAGKDGWPFVAPGGSSLWLATLLENAKIPEHGLYWINAKTDGQETGGSFLDALAPGKVIAMGLKASQWCNRHVQGRFYTISHPQYHKRFRHSEPYPLIDLLR